MPIKLDTSKNINEYKDYIYDSSLYVGVHASHLAYINDNNWFYIPELAIKSIDSWTYPYEKPVLKSHETILSEPIGRVIYARVDKNKDSLLPSFGTNLNDDNEKLKVIEYIKKNKDFIKDPYFASHYVYLILKINDSDSIKKILDGRYKTVSISASTNHAICSVCGTDWSTGDMCEHEPYVGGVDDDGNPKCFIAGGFNYDEVSIVNKPADKLAIIQDIYTKDEIEKLLNNKRSFVMEDKKKETKETTTNISDQTKTELEKENKTLKSKIESLEKEISKLKDSIKSYEEKIKILDEVNKEISTKLKDIYLAKIVDIYNQIGKEKTLEEVKEKYGDKSIEQIEDYISLISELIVSDEKEQEQKEETKISDQEKEEEKEEEEIKEHEKEISDEFKERKIENNNNNTIPVALRDAAAKLAKQYGTEYAQEWLQEQLEKLNKGDK